MEKRADVGRAGLAEKMRAMLAGGLVADAERASDLLVAHAGGKQIQDFAFARRERVGTMPNTVF
ncbi:hypothetical protein NMB33_33250 [Burkholderia sp. FXe9]|nr:hypothetical protein NMB33_33250 [Burkholderia sp. FXe9]